eukprot:TRINITY_DN37011_c0_g1_i2.p1 TRINITY_DN37011_c0_g1~~TRINITY_DN37011_c0_g1_i2.p1  ORF type:complete len:166 (+),score=41.50 TRINITY_DN37011_c0_g1_i2:39-536(+)
MPTKPSIYAYLTFHVRKQRLSAFCNAAAELIKHSMKDPGRRRMELHRELPWARSISNDEFVLFMMCQEWASAADLDAHTGSQAAAIFNYAIMKGRVLVTEPSVSIFGHPLSSNALAELGKEATHKIEAAKASDTMAPEEDAEEAASAEPGESRKEASASPENLPE